MTNPDFEILVDKYHKSLSRLIESLFWRIKKDIIKEDKKKHRVTTCLLRNQAADWPDNIIYSYNEIIICLFEKALQT